jgi:hypothetical protein
VELGTTNDTGSEKVLRFPTTAGPVLMCNRAYATDHLSGKWRQDLTWGLGNGVDVGVPGAYVDRDWSRTSF